MMASTCPHCGGKTQPGDNFCLKCGNRLLPATPSPQQQVMNNKELPLSPCLECGGPRALFQVLGETIFIHVKNFIPAVQLYACTCLQCGATTLRPAPHRMEEIRQWAETGAPFLLDS